VAFTILHDAPAGLLENDAVTGLPLVDWIDSATVDGVGAVPPLH